MHTVINLREESILSGQVRGWRSENGLFSFSLRRGQAPTFQQAQQILGLLSEPERWPILAHSGAGDGRAALLGTLVRYSFDGWEMERCLREARRFCCWRILFWLGLRTPLGGRQQAFLRAWERACPPGAFRPSGWRSSCGIRFPRPGRHAADMELLWQRLPESVRAVPVTLFEIAADEWESQYAGFYVPGQIHIRADLWSEFVFFHEYGHLAWHEVMNRTQREDWRRFWCGNLATMPREYSRTNPTEGHADCFALALLATPPQGVRPLHAGLRQRVLGYLTG